MRLGARNVSLEPDRDVAVALFCDGRDVRETAAFLGKSVQEIREAKERLKSVFANLLKARSGFFDVLAIPHAGKLGFAGEPTTGSKTPMRCAVARWKRH